MCVPPPPPSPAPTPAPPAQCLGEGQTCGGPGLPESTCCAPFFCTDFTDKKYWQCAGLPSPSPAPTPAPANVCRPRGASCGCAGCLTQTCCGGAQCLAVDGKGGEKYCVDTAEVAVGPPSR